MTERYSAESAGERDLQRLLAPNPSPMTGEGTNTYILGQEEVAIIDPGPALPDHLEQIMTAVGGRRVRAILVTHSHLDHSPAASALSGRLGAAVFAYGPSQAGRSETMRQLADHVGGGEGVDHAFRPDETLADGDLVSGSGWTLRAHHTPGHMANHLSFEWLERGEVFTGDTVMALTSTLISPPDGDLGQFMASMDKLAALQARRFHPGHGPVVEAPSLRCAELREHRNDREQALLAELKQPSTIPDLVVRIYADTPAALHAAAGRNVLAHLVHLSERGRVTATPKIHPDALWRLE